VARRAGGGSSDVLQNAQRNTVRTRQDVSRRDTEGSYPLIREPPIAKRIPFRTIIHGVKFTINLDGKPQGFAIEVQDVRADRMLPAKVQAV